MLLIECVPNLSEGRRTDRLAAWAGELRQIPGLALLDWTADAWHHRSVFTMAGGTDSVRAGALHLAECAVREIDLSVQSGVHPRIGAIDVVPFVPLRQTPMSACVALARDVGRTISRQWDLPVFLYEDAASLPHRRHLQDIRRGGFEGLQAKLATSGWAPDFGPRRPHPTAGAAAVGARPILIAYNINLATDRVAVAKSIAARIRERGGGLPAVKALGLLVDGHAQVSMNLVDYRQTPPRVAFDAVKALAKADGVSIAASELIGLIPEAALEGTSAKALQLSRFSPDRVLEHQLAKHGL
jgi:glutamate formiminotransferase